MRTEPELDQLMEDCFKEIQGAQIYDELRRLLSLLNRLDIHNVLEIGSESGGTVRVWSKMFNPLNLFTLDLNSYGHAAGKTAAMEDKWKTWLEPYQRLEATWGDSHKLETKDTVVAKMKSVGVGKVDFLYIDGDHTEAGVEKDYEMYKDLVRSGGIIVFHDIHEYPTRKENTPNTPLVGVYRFWERLKGPAVDMFENRHYHRGLRPNFMEICHDCTKQSSFGFGILFL